MIQVVEKAKIIDPPPPPPPPPWEPPKPGDDYGKNSNITILSIKKPIYLDNSDSDPYIYHQQGPDDIEKVKFL